MGKISVISQTFVISFGCPLLHLHLLAMILTLLFVTFLCCVCYHYLSRIQHYKLAFRLKGPQAFPLIGNVPQLMFKSNQELLEMLLYYGDKYDHPTRIWVGTDLYILTADPEFVQIILNAPECLNRDKAYKYVQPLMGNGLVTLPAGTWSEHRRLLNPTFSRQVLKSYIPIFNKETRTLTQRLRQELDKGTFDIYNYMDRCTLDAVCQTTMGVEMHVQENQNVDYLDAANNLLAISPKRMTNLLMRLDWVYKFSETYKIESRSKAITHGFVDKILKQRKANIKFDKNEQPDDTVDYKTPQPFLDQLLKLSGLTYFSEVEVKDESNTMVATGFESTALISSYCLLMLAMHPDVQEAVYQELISVCPGTDQDVTDEDYAKLKYLERVLKETMRLFPTVPTIARVSSNPFRMGEYLIPKDTHILISIMPMHRSERQWGKTAAVFDPDRFLPERFENIHKYAYVPFSGGKRNCIGLKYAMMFLKTIVVKLVREFEFSTQLKMHELKYSVDISLKLINKHLVEIKRRR